MVRSENKEQRMGAAEVIKQELEKISDIENIDIEKPLLKKEYQIEINQLEALSLGFHLCPLRRQLERQRLVSYSIP